MEQTNIFIVPLRDALDGELAACLKAAFSEPVSKNVKKNKQLKDFVPLKCSKKNFSVCSDCEFSVCELKNLLEKKGGREYKRKGTLLHRIWKCKHIQDSWRRNNQHNL